MFDFIEIYHYLFPVLHAEIGLVNNIMDALWEWIDERVELISEEERSIRNLRIVTELQWEWDRKELDDFMEEKYLELANYKKERRKLTTKSIKKRGIKMMK